MLGAYLGKLGLSELAIEYITFSSANEMQWFSGADATKLGIDLYLGECPEGIGDCTFTPTVTSKKTDKPVRPVATPRPALQPSAQAAGRAGRVDRSNFTASVACPNPADKTCCPAGYVWESQYRQCRSVSSFRPDSVP